MARNKYLPKNARKDEETKQKRLQKLKTRMSVAKKFDKKQRDKLRDILKILDFKREVQVSGDATTQKITYPLAWIAYENYLSTLSSTPPQVVIEAGEEADMLKNIYWRGVLDYQKRNLNIDDLHERFVDSFILSGKAVYKIGRRVETKTGVDEVKDENGKVLVKNEYEVVTRNESFVSIVDPRRFWISPETQYKGPVLGEECPYVIEEMVKSKEHVESRYDITVKEEELEIINPQAGLYDDKEGHDVSLERSVGENTDDMKRVRLFVYYGTWETKSGEVKENCEVLFTNNRIIRERELPYEWGNKKPYIVALNFPKYFNPVGRPALEPIVELDQEYNEHKNRIRTYIRRMVNPKWAKLKGTNVDEDALLDPDIGVIVDESQPNAFRPVTPPNIDSSIFEQATTVEQLFYLITGVNYGQSALNKEQTATGQSIQERATDVKMGRMVRVLERAQEERDTMLLQLEQQYADPEGTSLRIVGTDVVQKIRDKKKLFEIEMQMWEQKGGIESGRPQPIDEYENFEISEDGRSVYTKYSPEDIAGQFELTIISQSSNRSDRLVRAQQILNALDRSSADPTVKRVELWKRLFTIWGEDDVDDLVEQMNPQQNMQPPQENSQDAGNGIRKPELSAIQGSMQAQANKVV